MMAPELRQVLAVILALTSLPCLAQGRRSRQVLEQANRSLAAGLHHKAVEQYTQLLADDPSWPEPRLQRAITYSQMGEIDKALSDVDSLLAANPRHGEAFRLRGDLLLEADRPANAVEAFTKGIQQGLESAAVYTGRGAAYAKLRQWEKALADFDKGIKLRLDNPVPYKQRGVVKMETGQIQDAIEDFDRAITLKPDYWDAYMERANAYGSSGRFDVALTDLNRVLTVSPTNGRALGLRGSAQLLAGQPQKAIEDFTRALELSPREVRLLLARAAAYTQLGEHGKSLADRDRAVSLQPRMAEAYVARGGSHHELGEHEKGLADRSEAIRLNPGLAVAWAARGNAYFLLGRFDEAVLDLRKAVELAPEDTTSRDLLEKTERRIAAATPTAPAPSDAAAAAVSRPVEPVRNALTAGSIQELPRTSSAEAAAVSQSQAAPPPGTEAAVQAAPSAVPQQAVFTPVAPPLAQTAVSKPAVPVTNAAAVMSAPAHHANPPASPNVAVTAPKGGNPDALHMQGRALLSQRKFTEALTVLTQALALKPNFPMALNARGFAYQQLQQSQQALADFNAAIQFDPAYVNAFHNRAVTRRLMGDKAGAAEDQAKEQELLQKRR